MKQLFRRKVLTLQGADELQQIFIGDDVGRRCRELAEQVIDQRTLQAVALRGQVGHPIGRIGQHVCGGHAGEPFQVDRGLEQRIKGGGDEQIEIGDRGQTPQCQRRLEIRILDDAAQSHIGLFAAAACREEPADHIIESVRLRQLLDVHIEPTGEFLRHPVEQ